MNLGNATIYRPAEEKDRDTIKELLNQCFDSVYAKYAKMSFKSLEHALVVEEESRVIGVINWRIFQSRTEKIGYLFWLAIHPDFWRKGVGEGLIRKVLETLDHQKIPVVLTSVEKDNEPSRFLFKKLGFKLIDKAKMRKRLGKGGPRIYKDMWVMPWEDLFVKFPYDMEENLEGKA